MSLVRTELDKMLSSPKKKGENIANTDMIEPPIAPAIKLGNDISLMKDGGSINGNFRNGSFSFVLSLLSAFKGIPNPSDLKDG